MSYSATKKNLDGPDGYVYTICKIPRNNTEEYLVDKMVECSSLSRQRKNKMMT